MVDYDEIGIWSEVKLAIIKDYASAYAKILDATRREKIPSLRWFYIDAYAGPGQHVSKTTGDIVDGSPLIALKTVPPFSEYHFIDADPRRAELLRITRLERFVDRPAGQLSGGMYKKLGLMCALLQSPSVLLLDEPTNGVDPISRREFWELLYRLADGAVTIVISTAYMDEAERCARVHLLDAGRTIAEGEPRRVLLDTGAKSFDELFLRREAAK